MSISPPSDIVLDVVRAADPVRAREAAIRLDATAPADGKFEASLAAAAPAVKPPPKSAAATSPAGAAPTVYRDFEAMILANLIESAMPKDELFGSGATASIWKSVFVQEIGKAVAARGGVGLAKALEHDARLNPDGAAALQARGTPSASLVGGPATFAPLFGTDDLVEGGN